MVFKDNQELFAFVGANLQVPKHIQNARKETKTLKALIEGKRFKEVLIHKIEKLEDPKKAYAREKYSRAITDVFERLFRPIDNVYHSTGGSKDYRISNNEEKANFIKSLGNIRGGLSLERWLERHWMPQYHSDPSGLIYLEYQVNEDGQVKVWPTYKAIKNIRNYIPNGQKLEALIFEPFDVKYNGKECQVYRVVDDLKEYFVICMNAGTKEPTFVLIDNKEVLVAVEPLNGDKIVVSFEHPFGVVPGIINSDIVDIDNKPSTRLSPIWPIQPLCEELARDTSLLTLYKFQKAFPLHWMYIQKCMHCKGSGKTGTGDKCTHCDGKGINYGRDVTDVVMLQIPKEGDPKLAPDIAGYVSVDGEFWKLIREEIEHEEKTVNATYWGSDRELRKGNETATGRWLDVQPVVNRLTDLSETAANVERMLTEMIANALFPAKNKDERIALVFYGTNFIIESPDQLLNRYQAAKEAGDNSVILDRAFSEYLTAKFKNDPVQLKVELTKAKVEPYLHLTLQQVADYRGPIEVQRKILFQEWWLTLPQETIFEQSPEQLKEEFDQWFTSQSTPTQGETE